MCHREQELKTQYLVAIKWLGTKYSARKCRNWQTSKTKDLVHTTCVRVQVPPSALKKNSFQLFFFCVEGVLEPGLLTQAVQGLGDHKGRLGRR